MWFVAALEIFSELSCLRSADLFLLLFLEQDQHGCRFLQRKLEEDPERNLPLIYAEVFPDMVELMMGMRVWRKHAACCAVRVCLLSGSRFR